MINEIRERLDAGVEVDLELVDKVGFLGGEGVEGTYNNAVLDSSLKLVKYWTGDNGKHVFVTRDSLMLIDYEILNGFKIKERQEQHMSYSEKLINTGSKFQEMLAVASNAVTKGKLSSFIVNSMDHSDKIGNALYLGLNMTYHAIENEIKGINEMVDESSAVEQEVEEIKEVGFDDLIDAAIQAQKDGLIHKLEIISRRSIYVSEKPTSKTVHFNLMSIIEGIDFINSLYTETFMIKEFSDTKILKSGARAVLGNGEEVIFSNRCGVDDALWFEYNGCHSTIIPFIALKGATVTQQKGNK